VLTHQGLALLMIAVVPGEGESVMIGGQGLHHVDVFLPAGEAVLSTTVPADEGEGFMMIPGILDPIAQRPEVSLAVRQECGPSGGLLANRQSLLLGAGDDQCGYAVLADGRAAIGIDGLEDLRARHPEEPRPVRAH